MSGDKGTFSMGPVVDLSSQTNFMCLKDPHQLPHGLNQSEYVKQRTPEWHAIRNESPVTGSSIHNAIGIRTLKAMKTHYDVHIDGHTPQFDEDTQKRMAAGVENEQHATATLIAFFHPESVLCEDGARVISNDQGNLVEVSSDGLLKNHGTRTHVVEIKCPSPAPYKLPVQYEPPYWYACQLLAEMASAEVDRALFVSYSTESTAICEVFHDRELWNTVYSEINKLYGIHKVKPTKRGETIPALLAKLKAFVKKNTKLLVEIPSLTAEDLGLGTDLQNTPYIVGMGRSPMAHTTVGHMCGIFETSHGNFQSRNGAVQRESCWNTGVHPVGHRQTSQCGNTISSSCGIRSEGPQPSYQDRSSAVQKSTTQFMGCRNSGGMPFYWWTVP